MNGRLSAGEYYVGAPAAGRDVRVENHSEFEPLVMLKHFSNHPACPRLRKGLLKCCAIFPGTLPPI